MKFLFVARQDRHAAAYVDVLRGLAERGHQVAVAVQEAGGWSQRLAERPGQAAVRVTTCPPSRIDEWSSVAALARRLRDCIHYLRPPFRDSPPLQLRFFDRVRQDLGVEADTPTIPAALHALTLSQMEQIEAVLALAERGLPTSHLFDEFLRSEAPDVLLVCPLIHLGSSQGDVVASARRLGIPVWMLLFSWDNLSTKGSVHVEPDLLFVWNEQQRREAERLHGFPSARTIVVGAPRFDAFFEQRPALTRDQFLAPLGLDPQAATVLYLGSSPLVSPDEPRFVQRWLAALRASGLDSLRRANVVIRPHPANPLLPVDAPFARHAWPAAPHLIARVARPFDSGTVILETPHEDPAGLYESLAHCQAVVALNTTAELEAGIVGRPVFTIRPDAAAGGDHQATIHFSYLTREHGGFVSTASGLDEHLRQLEPALTLGDAPAAISAFVESFLRPHGLNRPVVPLLVDALETAASGVAGARAERADAVPVADAPSRGPEDRRLVPLGDGASHLSVHATPDALSRVTDRGVVRLDKGLVAWLTRDVHEGDVLYDINAEFGSYTLIAARQCRARVVAFEPHHRTYAALCDNLSLNECLEAVIPVPLPLAPCDELADGRRARPGRRSGQAYCWSRLDTLAQRYDFPPPNHVRLSPGVSPFDVLEGAERTLAGEALRTIWLEVPMDQQAAMTERLAAYGFEMERRKERRRAVKLLFVRRGAAEAPNAGRE